MWCAELASVGSGLRQSQGGAGHAAAEHAVPRVVAYTSAVTRIVLKTLALVLVTAGVSSAQVRVTLAARQYKAHEQIHAKLENPGTQPITICINVGQWSVNGNGDIEPTPSPFWVERNSGGKWNALLIGPDLGNYLDAYVLEAGKSDEFPFRLSDTGTMRLRFNYWLGSRPSLNCKTQPRGTKRVASPRFIVD
jgi:hypothetical protein